MGGGIKMTEERKKALQNLKTAKGQIEGILKMMEEDRYCIDISHQIMAATALLKKANMHILSGHLQTCVKTAMEQDGNSDEKLKEIEDVLGILLK